MKAIVVSFDRLNASLLGCYGNQEIPTPHWDRLASESVVFDQHFGENFDPQARNHAWWTGCYVFPRSAQSQARLPGLIRLLREAGVQTHLIRQRTSRVAALAGTAFQTVDEVGREQDASMGPTSLEQKELEAVVNRSVRRWQDLISDGAEHALMWIAFSGLPDPQPPEPTGCESAERTLASSWETDMLQPAVRGIDEVIGRLREELWHGARGDAPVLWILTAAAGTVWPEVTAFGEVSLTLNESLTHTPLLVSGPAGERQRGRVQELVQTVDLGPSLLEWFDLPVRAELEGRSWLPLVRAEPVDWRDSIYLGFDCQETAVRTRAFYLVCPDAERWLRDSPGTDGAQCPETTDPDQTQPAVPDRSESDDSECRCRLFVKPDDIWNVNDVADQSPDDVVRLRDQLRRFVVAAQSGNPTASLETQRS